MFSMCYDYQSLILQAMELLAEKCVSSGGANMTPGDALRRVFEAIASGVLLPGMWFSVTIVTIEFKNLFIPRP